MLRIGIDIQATQGKAAGLGHYTKQFIFHLRALQPSDMKFFYYCKETSKQLNTLERWAWENFGLPAAFRKENLDLLHTPAFSPPICSRIKKVVTVHDLIGRLFPNQMNWPSQIYWGHWLPFAVRRANKIAADSEHTRKDLEQHLKIDSKKIEVIYPSGHEGFESDLSSAVIQQAKQRAGCSKRYFVFVGTIEPRKNLLRAIQALHEVNRKRNDGEKYQLLVVGSKDFAHGKMFRDLKAQLDFEEDDILFTGYVDHGTLNALYCGAVALVFPSLYEGFGIPPLEAMASGTPVITSRLTSLPEVAGNAASYVNPYQVEAIAEAMLELAVQEPLRRDLVQKGFEQIKRFSWKRTAEQFIHLYRNL